MAKLDELSVEARRNTRGRFEQWVKNSACQAKTLSAVLNVKLVRAKRSGKKPRNLIELNAYHSRSFGDNVKGLPTQSFTNELVSNSVKKGKLVVKVRNCKTWDEQAPALISYSETGNVATTTSAQNTSLSPGRLKTGYENPLRAVQI